jgi:hypothetical protein
MIPGSLQGAGALCARISSRFPQITMGFKALVFYAMLNCGLGARADLFTWADGSPEIFGGTASGDVLVLNHYISATPVLIDQVFVSWPELSVNVHPAVALYADPNGDGNPFDMTPIAIFPIFMQPGVVILNGSSIDGYDVSPTLVDGSFFLGAFISDQERDFDPSNGIDLTHLGPGQSWIIENRIAGALDLNNPIATSTLVTSLENYIGGNFILEAHFAAASPVPEGGLSSCAAMAFAFLLIVCQGRARLSAKVRS